MKLMNIFKRNKKDVAMSKSQAREVLRSMQEKYTKQTIFDNNK